MLTTDQRADAAIRQYGAQSSDVDISAVTGVPVASLRQARRRLGVDNPTRRGPDGAEDARIADLLTGGASVAEVARQVGRSWSYVQRRALLAGVRVCGRKAQPPALPSPPVLAESDPRALRPLPPPPDISGLGLTVEDLRAGMSLRGGRDV